MVFFVVVVFDDCLGVGEICHVVVVIECFLELFELRCVCSVCVIFEFGECDDEFLRCVCVVVYFFFEDRGC